MALEYACLQLHIAAGTELPRERILYAVTSYMDRMGMIPCGQENATRTICFAPSEAGWSVYDDCADRLDIPSIDGLGRCLTGKIDCRAVGILASKEGLMLSLYGGGRLRDAYVTSCRAFGRKHRFPGRLFCRGRCRGHALRWRACLPAGRSVAELADLFEKGESEGRAVFPRLMPVLGLDKSAAFGFASVEEAGIDGVVWLYFRPGNVIHQGLLARMLHPAPRTVKPAAGISPMSPKR